MGIVTQHNHALLSAQICLGWRKTDQPERFIETLMAVSGHDDVFDEFERGSLLFLSGGPLD